VRKLFAAVITFWGISWGGLAGAQYLPPPVNIPIMNLPQETEVWCWAAVAQQLVLRKVGPGATPPQCGLVAIANGAHPAYCCSGYNPACVKTGSFPQIQALIAHFGGSFAAIVPPASPSALYNTLAAGQPVLFQIKTGPASSHVIVVRGMRFDQAADGTVIPILLVNDPMSKIPTEVPFHYLAPKWMSAMVVLS
jgi:hypothetical protein